MQWHIQPKLLYLSLLNDDSKLKSQTDANLIVSESIDVIHK